MCNRLTNLRPTHTHNSVKSCPSAAQHYCSHGLLWVASPTIDSNFNLSVQKTNTICDYDHSLSISCTCVARVAVTQDIVPLKVLHRYLHAELGGLSFQPLLIVEWLWQTSQCTVLQFFFLIVPSYFSFILIVYLLGEVDAATPILLFFSFTPHLLSVSLTFLWT